MTLMLDFSGDLISILIDKIFATLLANQETK